MIEVLEDLRAQGQVQAVIEYRDNRPSQILEYPNSVLKTGRRALVKCLTNQIEGDFSFYVTRMLFGDGGTYQGTKKYVNVDRNGLFGVTRLSKPVMANINSNITTQGIFTSVINFDEGVGVVFNEMALQMSNGDLYSMTTFPDLTKTEEMRVVFNWRLNFI